ncbi:MAG: intradiol ring-cleavage dioxygenase [Gemmatimonadetes bacterium]|nr:intradiol ring-cleavage dioxygenase [Gemmatimonadota bacterium]MBK9411388.1 intradiol ring-cleavage dioxygenase [Gemmatimonadota bacterium]
MAHNDFGGLHDDLRLTDASLRRRALLRLALGAGAMHLLGCSKDPAGLDDEGTPGNGSCSTIPSETAGPYPGDGSNGPNVLGQSGVVRSDIRSSFAGLSGTAVGIPLVVTLTLVSQSNGCAPLPGRAIYLWHCDRAGLYSLYSAGATSQNYLRGVQQTNAQGEVTFTTIFPGCYAGRWPHMHFEVYQSLATATSAGNKIATSQLAIPKAACDAVYATTGYASSLTNLSQVSLASDNVFADGASLQLATMGGNVVSGYTAALQVSI